MRWTDRRRTVDLHLAVCNDGLDLALLLEVLEAPAGERAVDLHAVDEGGDGDEAVRLDVLVELLRSGLVEHDGMLGLVLDCSRVSVVSLALVRDEVGGDCDFRLDQSCRVACY